MALAYTGQIRTDAGDGTFDGVCSCGFETQGWTEEANAQARIDAHLEEHATGVPMPEITEWLGEQTPEGEPA